MTCVIRLLMHVVTVCDPGHVDGGAPKVAITAARGLADAGHEITFIYAVAPASKALKHPRIHLEHLDFDSVWNKSNPFAAAAQGIWNSAAARKFADVLRPMNPANTIVHFHQWTKALSPSVLPVPSRFGISSIVSLHDYFLACPNGAYYKFPAGAPCSLTPMSAACLTSACDSRGAMYKGVRVLRQHATRQALKEAGSSLSLLNVSQFAQNMIDKFIPGIHRRFVVRSPIEQIMTPPTVVTENTDFLFVGRITVEKGIRQLVRAALETGLPLTLAGEGPLLNEVRDTADNIRCAGWLNQNDLVQTMSKARALIFPSTWYETGGLVVLDAMAQGIPVIVSNRTAPVEYIVDGENGFVIDPDDPTTLSQRMLDLTDNTLAQRMGLEAYRHYWKSPRTVEAHVAELLNVYRSILVERPSNNHWSAAWS